MKTLRVLFLGLVMVAAGTSAASDQWTTAAQLETDGHFREAAAWITNALASPALADAERRSLEFELDRLDRIRRDYPHTKESLFAALQKSLKNLTRDEFEEWIVEGRFDRRRIDAEDRFMSSSVSNLYFRYPELESRRRNPRDRSTYERALLESCRAIRAAAQRQNSPFVLPKTFDVTMTVTAAENVAPAGELIRAWLPIPRDFPHQDGFKLLASTPLPQAIAPADSPIRSLFLEQPARRNRPTRFVIRYAYTTHGVWHDMDARSTAIEMLPIAVQPWLREQAHVEFTPELRALSARIIGDTTNPVTKAKRLYDWIADQIQYSYAIEYSTIRNISEYCRARGYGDCGQEALLFIALCRLNGIPARWQSGWFTFPGGQTIHDWCEIYLAPHGWVPVDNYMGIWATRYARTLSEAEKHEVREFYFGGLDQYRMAANADHSQELTPPKRSFRSDNVDFQRGELEWGDRNLYFDKFDYELEVREVKSRR